MENFQFHPASFRDSDGRIFLIEKTVYRGLSAAYLPHYEKLKQSGLMDSLLRSGKLIEHEVVIPQEKFPFPIILKPQPIPYISYPYEWSFSQYKDAALLTLSIQMEALNKGMTLKDASAYNIQFLNGKPVLIDIASFETYVPDLPWLAYGQFCRHFLAPLLLMSKCNVESHRFMQTFLDGIPLPLASSMLPFSTRFSPFIQMHIHLHARSTKRYQVASEGKKAQSIKMPLLNLKGMIDSMQGFIHKLTWKPEGVWRDYYKETQNNYEVQAFQTKQTLIARWISLLNPASVWDLGGNMGVFSRLASEKGVFTVCFDIDPAAVEMNYLSVKAQKAQNLLPLVMDLTQPSPAIGWANAERQSMAERGSPDIVMALALIHHLSIGNNLPLSHTAAWFASLAPFLIIEFVPKIDSQVQVLLTTRKDIFTEYTQPDFEEVYSRFFTLVEKVQIPQSERIMYLWKRLDIV